MLSVLALTLLSTAQITADDERRPRVPLCTAQDGQLDSVLAVRRADGQVWWFPWREPRATPYDLTQEMTARQKTWFIDRQPLTVDGLSYAYKGEDEAPSTAFRRYNAPIEPIDGVPAMVPMGRDDEVWVLLDPIGCRFGVWTRAKAN